MWVQQSTKSSLVCLIAAKRDYAKSLTEELVINSPISHADGATTPMSSSLKRRSLGADGSSQGVDVVLTKQYAATFSSCWEKDDLTWTRA